MENSNEQSQSYIINLLVKYGSLNSIYNEVFEKDKLTVFQQQKIYNFYNDFQDVEMFETELLCFFYLDNLTKNRNILNQLKSRIQSNVSLYDENSRFINKVNVYEVCYLYIEYLYKDRIKLLHDRVCEFKTETRNLDREYDSLFYSKSLSKDKENMFQIRFKELRALEAEAQKEHDDTYKERNVEQNEIFKYKKNVFKDIQELGLRFISIINSYSIGEKEVVAKGSIIDPKSVEHFEKKEDTEVFKNIEIKEGELFKPKMFIKLLNLEKLLLKEGLLDNSLKWNSASRGKITVLRLVIIFIDRLDANNYFMGGANDSAKCRFFESRYNVKIGQNFEKNKRNKYLYRYHGVYSDYPF